MGSSPQADKSQLYRNLGNGQFIDVSEEVGNSGLRDGACYIAPILDFDGDGNVDLLITQEFGQTLERNQLYKNLGVSSSGSWIDWENKTPNSNIQYPYAAMGAAVFDLNQDLLPELFITNLIVDEPLREVLLMNQGEFVFEDITELYGANGLEVVSAQNLHRTASWGAQQFDYDNDGDEDLYTAYGTITPIPFPGMTCESYSPICMNQPNALMRNDNDSGFTQLQGSGTEDNGLSRGIAAADLNEDGCLDLYVVNQNTPSRLLLNPCDHDNNHAVFHLEGTVSNRDAVGAVIQIQTEGKRQTKYITAGATSVHSAQPFRVHVGLGDAERIDSIVIYWPSGIEDRYENIELDTAASNHIFFQEGSGILSP